MEGQSERRGLTLGIGQQPYTPLLIRQQVVSSGHDDSLSGHSTVGTRREKQTETDDRFHPESAVIVQSFLLTIVGRRRHRPQQRHARLSRPADAVLQVTDGVARATVEVVAAAHGLHTSQKQQSVKQGQFAALAESLHDLIYS